MMMPLMMMLMMIMMKTTLKTDTANIGDEDINNEKTFFLGSENTQHIIELAETTMNMINRPRRSLFVFPDSTTRGYSFGKGEQRKQPCKKIKAARSKLSGACAKLTLKRVARAAVEICLKMTRMPKKINPPSELRKKPIT